jgi:hypothetical protein
MKWKELTKKHEQESEAFTKAYNESKAQLMQDEIEIMKACGGESKISNTLKEKMERDRQTWQDTWGIDGEKTKALKEAQKKEVDAFLQRQNVLQQMRQGKNDSREKERD